MNKNEFFTKYCDGIVLANNDSVVNDNFLFSHPEEISRVQEFDTKLYQVVSVHETENNDDYVDINDIDYGNQPFKYGYYVIKR